MTSKFPIWIYVVIALQMLIGLVLAAVVMVFDSDMSGVISHGGKAAIAILLLLPLLSLWLSRWQWQANQHLRAMLLAFIPIILWLVASGIVQLVLA